MELLESLKEYSSLFLAKKTPPYERNLLDKINSKNRIIGIVGAKGVGKTTLILHISLYSSTRFTPSLPLF